VEVCGSSMANTKEVSENMWSWAVERTTVRSCLTGLALGGTLFVIQRGVNLVSSWCWEYLKSSTTITLEINSKDESYQWFIEWMAQHPYSKQATQLSLETAYDSESGTPQNNRPKIILTPCVGNHLLMYKGKYIWLNRNRDTSAADLTNRGFLETLKLTVFGKK